MKPLPLLRNVLAAIGGVVLVLIALGILFRRSLAEMATHRAVADTGIEIKRVDWKRVGPTSVAENLQATFAGQTIAVDRIEAHATGIAPPQLGQVKIEGVRVQVDPPALMRYLAQAESSVETPGTAGTTSSLPPIAGIASDLHFRLGENAQPLLDVAVNLSPEEAGSVAANVTLSGGSSRMEVAGKYAMESGDAAFTIPSSKLDVGELLAHFRELAPSIVEGIDANGGVELSGSGSIKGEDFKLALRAVIKELAIAYKDKNVEISGIRGTVVSDDVIAGGVHSDGLIIVDRAVIGTLVGLNTEVTDLRVSPTRITMYNFATHLFGGTLSLADLDLNPETLAATAVVRFSGVDMAELAKLVPNLGAEVVGRADGEVPLIYDGKAVQFGRGWISLAPRTLATVKIDRPGLITGGMAKNSPAFPILSKVENGMLYLKVTNLRAELFPATREGERSATLRIAGVPVDPDVHAPVSLDVNVNGPLAALISWGMNDNVSFGAQTR